jgi:hypothetical protein
MNHCSILLLALALLSLTLVPACTPEDQGSHITWQAYGLPQGVHITIGDAGTCPAETGDTPCVSCAKANCCAEAVACDDDPACTGPSDPTFSAAAACLSEHCPAACGRDQ